MTEAVDPREARHLFDANAVTYDAVNTAVSWGLESRWRSWVARKAVTRPGERVLDAFAGTGRVGLQMARRGAAVTSADISPRMLAVASWRAGEEGLDVGTVTVDLTSPDPHIGGSFDAVTVMWGLRYVNAPAEVLRRLVTLLAPNGRVVVVEFVEPRSGLISGLAAAYFFHVVPWIAGVLGGKRELYRELVATTHAMGPREHLIRIVREAGLEIIEEQGMGFGLVLGLVAHAKNRS